MSYFKSSLAFSCVFLTLSISQNAFSQDAIDEVQVIGQYIPDEKRSTSEISEILSADDFSISGDSDISVALTRLPGLSSDSSGRYIVVRGLKERYSTTLLNGVQLPAPDPLKNSVPLDIFPTSLIEDVLVQKTYSAQYPGSFAGSIIDLRTKKVPDENFVNISFSGGYETESTFEDGFNHNTHDDEWTGYDNDWREFPSNLIDYAGLENLNPQQIELAGQSIPNVWSIVQKENEPDISAKFSVGRALDTRYGRLGMVGVVDYSSKKRNRFSEQFFYASSSQGLELNEYNSKKACRDVSAPEDLCGYTRTSWNIDLNAMFSVGLEIDERHLVNYTSTLLRSSEKRSEIKQGLTDSSDLRSLQRIAWYERELLVNTLSGESEFSTFDSLDPILVEWSASLLNSSRDVPMQKEVVYFWTGNENPDEHWRISTRSDGNYTFYSYMEDEGEDVNVTLTQLLELAGRPLELKFGGAYFEKERLSKQLRYHYSLRNVRNPDLLFKIPEIVFGNTNVHPLGIQIEAAYEPTETFNAYFENEQAFWQADIELSPRLRVSGGYRYEDSHQEVLTFVRSRDGLSSIPELSIQDIEAYLGSSTITYEIFDNMQLRMGYSNTINRPDSRELAPSRFLGENGRFIQGTQGLKHSEIDNFDLRFEWYMDDDQYFSIAYFHKEIDSPIEYAVTQLIEDELDRSINSAEAELSGVEIETRAYLYESDTRLYYLKNNVSYVDTDVTRTLGGLTSQTGPLQGQSEILFNLQLGFENQAIHENLNLAINYTGIRVYRLGTLGRPDIKEQPPLTVNLVYSRELPYFNNIDDAKINVKVKNILGEAPEFTQGGKPYQIYDDYGTEFSLGFSLDF